MLATLLAAVACTPSSPMTSLVAGAGPQGSAGNGGRATSAQLDGPVDVAVDGEGRVFIAEVGGRRVRVVSSAGTLAMATEGPGPGAAAMVPWGLALDGAGALYIADAGNHRVWRLSDSQLEPVAGSGEPGFSGDGGRATSARLLNPRDIEVDRAGNLYIADMGNRRVRKVTREGEIMTIAGTGQPGGFGDFGPARAASVEPRGLAVDGEGTVYIAEAHQNRVRAVRPDGTIVPIAGTGEPGFAGDGDPATEAVFNGPVDVAVDDVGTIYVADTDNRRIRRIRRGVVTTVTRREATLSDDPDRWLSPLGLAVRGRGDLYFADANLGFFVSHHRVRRLLERTSAR